MNGEERFDDDIEGGWMFLNEGAGEKIQIKNQLTVVESDEKKL